MFILLKKHNKTKTVDLKSIMFTKKLRICRLQWKNTIIGKQKKKIISRTKFSILCNKLLIQ